MEPVSIQTEGKITTPADTETVNTHAKVEVAFNAIYPEPSSYNVEIENSAATKNATAAVPASGASHYSTAVDTSNLSFADGEVVALRLWNNDYSTLYDSLDIIAATRTAVVAASFSGGLPLEFSSDSTLTQSPVINQSIGTGETLVIENKCFSDITGYAEKAVKISGQGQHSDTTLIIRNCRFTHVSWAIAAENVGTVIVEGCYFDSVGFGVRLDSCGEVGGSSISYNKLRWVGYYDSDGGMTSAIKVVDCETMPNIRMNGNIIDLKDMPRTRDDADYYGNYVEDLISVINSGGASGKPMVIANNKVRGQDSTGSATGGGIIVGDGDLASIGWINVVDNIIVNAPQYNIGVAGGHYINVTGNNGFITLEHDLGTQLLPGKSSAAEDASVGFILSSYGGTTPSNVYIDNNVLIATRSWGQYNISSSFNADSGIANLTPNNNFTWDNGAGGKSSEHVDYNMLTNDMFLTYGSGVRYFDESQACEEID